MGKTDYEKLKDEVTAKVKATGGTRFSKSDMTQMTASMLNSKDYEVKNYIKDVKDPVITKPVERYRETLKPVLKQFGVDNAELDKVQTITFGKDHAEALNDLSMQIVKDYTSTGRKLILPINEADEAQMEISQRVIEEKEIETTKIEAQADGTFKSVPTGKKKKTKKHVEMKVSNKVPAWLTEVTDI
jgi:hypothetical protein